MNKAKLFALGSIWVLQIPLGFYRWRHYHSYEGAAMLKFVAQIDWSRPHHSADALLAEQNF